MLLLWVRSELYLAHLYSPAISNKHCFALLAEGNSFSHSLDSNKLVPALQPITVPSMVYLSLPALELHNTVCDNPHMSVSLCVGKQPKRWLLMLDGILETWHEAYITKYCTWILINSGMALHNPLTSFSHVLFSLLFSLPTRNLSLKVLCYKLF